MRRISGNIFLWRQCFQAMLQITHSSPSSRWSTAVLRWLSASSGLNDWAHIDIHPRLDTAWWRGGRNLGRLIVPCEIDYKSYNMWSRAFSISRRNKVLCFNTLRFKDYDRSAKESQWKKWDIDHIILHDAGVAFQHYITGSFAACFLFRAQTTKKIWRQNKS